MFKGFKKRFGSNRSGRNRRLGPGVREQETSPREPPDKGGIKPTSPRQIHPVDQISPVPYARRSLDRRTRTIPPGKSNSPINTGYDRRTESFCLSPTKDQQLQQQQMTTAVAYPTTPNICVTGGKIEFITPPGSTISSNASGNCSTLFSSPSLSSSPSPKEDSPSHRSRSTLPVNVTQKHSPSRRNSSRRRKSPKVSSPISCTSCEKPEGPSEVPTSPSATAYLQNSSMIISESPKHETNELNILREENKQMKEELSTLQEEFSKLQEYVRELEGTLSSKKDTSSEEMDRNEPSQFQILVERCNTLEQVNAQLQAESVLQRQQYEKCLDKVASKVVQAILVQKTQQEQCERLTKKVEDLKQQNMTLSSIIVSKGKYQSLNHCRKTHLLPVSLISNSNSNSLSLPNTLMKSKTHCDTDNSASTDKAANCWYNNNINNNNNKEKITCPTYKSLRVRLEKCNRLLPRNSSSSLPQSSSSKKTSLHHQSSADGCWYDIIKSLQNGDASHANIQNGITDNNNTSSDNSSVDTERNLDSQNRMLRSTEDDVSTSSSGDDFHALGFSSSISDQKQQQIIYQVHDQQQQQQGENSTTPCFPSNSASNNFNRSFNSNVDVSLVTSSQYLNSKTLSLHKGRMQDINLDFVPSQSSYHNTVIANFTVNSSPKLDNKVPTFSCNNNKSIDKLNNSCKTTNKIDNSNSPDDQKAINESEGKSTEGTVKDEGYSTMSSDVQSEAKDSVAVVTISTVVEERGKSFDGESESKEESPTETLNTSSVSFETLKLENNNNNNKNLNVGVVSLSVKDSDQPQPEYSDGLRVVYDDEEDNSDILYVPIAEENDRYLMRHSFNFPFPNEPVELQRCSSDSYLYKLFVRFPNCSNIASKRLSTNHNALQSLPLKKQNHSNIYNTYLRRAFRKESLKRECLRLFNRPLVPNVNDTNNENRVSNSFNYDFLSQVFPQSSSHPRILSPSYSHAEMEDWSLDLSGEDITTPGGTEPSAAESSAPSHHHSQPSIQEATLDLEEDHNDFLWNGATYFKAVDSDLSWPYAKDQTKSWDLSLVGNKHCRSMISPKSGCSDQPAMWSSSEHLSCCSDIASKCSTDIENFCEQLCNLPELKRISVCSSENGGNESLPSNTKLSEIDSIEDNSELTDDINIETVFTRDFYRLVKFESTKSLTASSKSLATSEGFLTLEKLKGFESLHNNKTLASVLGFIAEQQKYCKDREVMDENASFGPVVNQIEDPENREASFHLRVSEDSQINNEMENPNKRNVQDNVLTSSESCADLNTGFRGLFSNSLQSSVPPPKPKRSTSLNLGNKGVPSYRSRGTLPPLPSTYSPPPIPSRSTSRSTLPHHHAFSRPVNLKSTSDIPEEPFPPPPPEDSYVEPYHAIPMAPPPPKIPPHRIPVPIVPKRSSSVGCHNSSCDSPPVPKRITSRALPVPPPILAPPRSSSLDVNKCSSEKKPSGKCNRPKSLLKESTSNTSKIQARQKRGSCGDLAPLCRNSATLMLELQKMAKAEEEEKARTSAVLHSPEATSPGSEVGLGTGWVRIEPSSDLGDPQTRANILDTMLQSSEGCSSETDEDIAKHLQHTELLRAVQRNRRKRKASRHNGSDPLRVLGGVNPPPRPTILGRHSLFNRFGEEEENALKEFQFLESFPSQSDVIGSCDQNSPFIYPQNPIINDDALMCHSINLPSTSLTRLSPPTDLKNLRSSEPCPDELIYPIYSSTTQCLDDSSLFVKSSSSLPSTSHTNNVSCPPLNRTVGSLSYDKNITKNSDPTRKSKSSTDENIKLSFRSFEKVANLRSNDLNDNNKTYKCNVPSPRLDKANCFNDLCKKSDNSGERQSVVESHNTDGRNLCNNSNMAVKTEANKLLKGNSGVTQIKNNSKANTEESKLVDTRSISNVKEIIEKLNNKNSSSGKLIQHSGNNRNGRNSNSCNSNNSDITSSSIRNSKPSFISTKPRPPSVLATTSNRCSDSLSPNVEPSNSSSTTNENSNANVSKKYCQSKRTPKLPGSNLIKRLTSNSFQSKDTSASLPPKGVNASTRATKDRQNIPSRLSSRAIGAAGKGLRSPRLPRLKLNGSRGDPLSSFNEKGMCDSGSSEGSEKGCGRISISDSCAEIFSLGESGDEVFLKHS